MNYFDHFFNQKKDLLNAITMLDQKHGLNLRANLKRTKAEDEFLATITEANFGLLFDSISNSIKYEYKVFSESAKTPDWTFIINDQCVVAEVVRLNQNESDQKISDFENSLMNILESIELPVLLELDFNDKKINEFAINKFDFKLHVYNWLISGINIGDETTYSDSITVILRQTNRNTDHAHCIGSFHPMRVSESRLSGRRSRLCSKVDKYAPLVEATSIPFIVCLYLHFESWFKPEDLFKALYGSSVEVCGLHEFDGHVPGSYYHDFSNGLFYSNQHFKNNVSGILVSYNNTYSYFHNFSSVNRLNKQNKELLMQFQFTNS